MRTRYPSAVELNPQEIAELAEFFARRFPERDAPSSFASELRLSLGNALTWQELVEAAHARGRLRALARAAVQRRPDDPNLRELERTLVVPKSSGRAWIVGLGLAAVIGAGLLMKLGDSSAPGGSDPPAPSATPSATPRPQPTAPATPNEPPPGAQSAAETPVAPPAVPANVPAAVPATVPPAEPAGVPSPEPKVEAAAEAPAVPGKTIEGRCGGPAGERVGYWYAGKRPPGAQGELITLSTGANVRTDYPRRDNRWRYNFPAVCSLEAGDKVRLSAAPIRVDGGDYWVPLHAGDLSR